MIMKDDEKSKINFPVDQMQENVKLEKSMKKLKFVKRNFGKQKDHNHPTRSHQKVHSFMARSVRMDLIGEKNTQALCRRALDPIKRSKYAIVLLEHSSFAP